jgi:hypothetical protein
MSSSDRQRRHARRLSRSGRNTIMLPIDFYFDFASPYGFLAAMQREGSCPKQIQLPREMLFTRAAHSIATSVIGFSVAECSV